MVVAHPDDEILFGWPVFFNDKFKKCILMCSTDENNTERSWCVHRKKPLQEICDKEDIPLFCLPNNSSFYNTQTRRPKHLPRNEYGDSQAPFRKKCDEISSFIIEYENKFDYIFTHNPFGEYGHMDHKLIFDIVIKTTTKPVLITDINMSSNWSKKIKKLDKIKKMCYNEFYSSCNLDLSVFAKYKSFYEKHGVWTWSREVPTNCNLFLI